MKLLNSRQVAEKLNITKAALPALRRREPSFPKPIRVSEKVHRWDEQDIENWLLAKKEE